jgi:hypothetical protein
MTPIEVTLEVIDPSVLGMNYFQLVELALSCRHRMMFHLGYSSRLFDPLQAVLLHWVACSQYRHLSSCSGLGWSAKSVYSTEAACLMFLRSGEIGEGSWPGEGSASLCGMVGHLNARPDSRGELGCCSVVTEWSALSSCL